MRFFCLIAACLIAGPAMAQDRMPPIPSDKLTEAQKRAYVLADNRRMLDLITRFTLVESRKTEQSVTELVFTLRLEQAASKT